MSACSGQIVGIIPARGGSKRVLNKNISDLCGKPLIQYTIDAALASSELDRVILSTDDESIAEVGRRLGVEVPFIRPAVLAEDATAMPPVIKHALQWIAKEEGVICGAVVVLQPTCPLRRTCDIDGAIDAFRRSNTGSLVGVCKPREDPFDLLIPFGDKLGHLIPREERSFYSKFYFLNGAIYIVSSQVVLEREVIYLDDTDFYEMDWSSSIDVDTPEDMELAALLLESRVRKGGVV